MKKMITDILAGIRKNPNKFVRRFSVSLLTVNICSLLYSLSCFFKVVKWLNDDNMTRFFTGELPVQINGYLNGSSQGFTVFRSYNDRFIGDIMVFYVETYKEKWVGDKR